VKSLKAIPLAIDLDIDMDSPKSLRGF